VDTLNRRIQELTAAGDPGIYIAVWSAAVLKTVAAVLPLVALRRVPRPRWNRTVWVLAWAAGAFLTIYGLLQTAMSQLAAAGVIHAPASAVGRPQTWSGYLWDPWFLIWGLLVIAALLRGRNRRTRTQARG